MYKLAVLNTHPIQYFAPLYQRLAREANIDLTVYFCSQQGAEEYFDSGFAERVKWDRSLLDGYSHKFLKNWRTADHVAGFWSLINLEIIAELRQHRFDALWVNGHNHASYLIGIFAARFLNIPVFMRCETHLGLQRSAFKRALRKPLMSFLYNHLCDACLFIGTLNKEFYVSHGVKEEHLFSVPYAVDNDYFIAAAEQSSSENSKRDLGLPLDKPIILFASKLTPRKRPMDLLRAFQRLCADGTSAALVLVGSGEEEQTLRNFVIENQLLDVYFVGFRNQSELPKYYAAADVFVFPSENEPWGLVLNEVMCAGVPVIASEEIGSVPDLLRRNENGYTYRAGDIDRLADYLKQLLSDPEKRMQMGRESRRIIEKWNYDQCVSGIKQALAALPFKASRIGQGQTA